MTEQSQQDKRKILTVGNRWRNSIYTGYGILKQRIFLEIIDALQAPIHQVTNGTPVDKLKIWGDQFMELDIDLSRISHYNNYYYVRKALKEMVKQPIRMYNDPKYVQPLFEDQPLLAGAITKANGKMARIRISRHVAEMLVFVNYGRLKSGKMGHFQFTTFDKDTCRRTSTKYMMKLYLLISGYAEKGGFTISLDDLRRDLCVEEKYKGFDNFNRFILQHVQKELTIFGKYCYNFSVKKTGKTVSGVVFKVFENKAQVDTKHHWLLIQKMFDTLPQFRPFTYEQREQLNYLFTSTHDLQEVHQKFKDVHKALVRRKELGQKTYDPFAYTRRSIFEKFPPPE